MFTLILPRTFTCALLLCAAVGAQAATLLVTTTTDSYDGVCNRHCSLRDAVTAANQASGASIILLSSGNYGLSRLDVLDQNDPHLPIDDDNNLSGDLDIRGDLLIKGAGITKSSIDGLGVDVLRLRHRLVEVRPGARLVLDNLTLKGSYSAGNGGALENHGHALLRKVRALDNMTRNNQLDAYGGAIANYASLLVLSSHFERNRASADYYAYGGAIYNSGSLLLRDSSFLDNSTDTFSLVGPGGAIYNQGRAEIWGSYFSENSNAEYTQDGIVANEGGELTIGNSTLSGNWSQALSNGRADSPGVQRSKTTLTNVTITRNTNGDVGEPRAVLNGGELLIRNSIIAGNYDQYSDLDNPSAVPSNCMNVGDHYSYQAVGLLRNDEQSNCSANLFVSGAATFTQVLSPTPTQHKQTWTHDLLPGSPAIDAAIGDCPDHDQRGAPRPQDGDGDEVAICDLGAFELGAIEPTVQ